MARPKKPIDPKMVSLLAQRGCKTIEIATALECSPDTIQRRFAAELAKGRADLKLSLRQWQLEAAKRGNITMLIWLGKQYLDQTEKLERREELNADKTDQDLIQDLSQQLKTLKDFK